MRTVSTCSQRHEIVISIRLVLLRTNDAATGVNHIREQCASPGMPVGAESRV